MKKLGQSGARKLSEGIPSEQSFLLPNARWLKESGLTSITLDADLPRKISIRISKAILRGETSKSVCGNKEGVAKGFNTTKISAKSYHPLLVFVSELKQLNHTCFKTGSAYIGNGIADFLKEVQASLSETTDKVFFRANSAFFSEEYSSYWNLMCGRLSCQSENRSGHQMELKSYSLTQDWETSFLQSRLGRV